MLIPLIKFLCSCSKIRSSEVRIRRGLGVHLQEPLENVSLEPIEINFAMKLLP